MDHWAKYYAMHIEFQDRGSRHVRSLTWIFNTPNIQNEAAYIDFIAKNNNCTVIRPSE